mmetsp:Transcript_5698/g.18770  ORF Transcript_5698/g.18770 Transcript_5698/m.18770 type:complete len:83 (-) Transcript_5698:100-348(-)
MDLHARHGPTCATFHISNGDTLPDKHDTDVSPIWADLLFIEAEGDTSTEEHSPEEFVKTFLDAQDVEEKMLAKKGELPSQSC